VSTVTVLIDAELRSRLERAAAAHERSLGGEVRVLLRRYLSDADEEETP
jgi:plasmid stability protein